MSIARIILITLLVCSSIVILALYKFNQDTDLSEPEIPGQAPSAATSAPPPTAARPTSPPIPSDDDLLAPDEMAEDEEVEREQISAAMTQLNSTNDEERIEAVEQLGAYPNPETEATLSHLLIADRNPEIRNAAALGLGSLEEPSEATIGALLSALDDANEDVRFSALSTLEDFMLGQEEDSNLYRRIHDSLSAKAASRGLPEDLRDSINEIIRDQQLGDTPDNEQDN